MRWCSNEVVVMDRNDAEAFNSSRCSLHLITLLVFMSPIANFINDSSERRIVHHTDCNCKIPHLNFYSLCRVAIWWNFHSSDESRGGRGCSPRCFPRQAGESLPQAPAGRLDLPGFQFWFLSYTCVCVHMFIEGLGEVCVSWTNLSTGELWIQLEGSRGIWNASSKA